MSSILTPEQRQSYERDGYILIPGLFDREEIGLLRSAMETDPEISGHFFDRRDADGLATKMALWNHPGDSVYGLAARSERVVDTMEELLGGEVYHYHSKLTAKEPREGGAWEWHQDYGYWYHNGCLFPLMASLMVALDHTTAANGCLQVLRGSHLMGRIEHNLLDGQQVGADLKRVDQALQKLERVYVEMEPGDGLFFHCNTLHRSDQNRSENRRWTLLMCSCDGAWRICEYAARAIDCAMCPCIPLLRAGSTSTWSAATYGRPPLPCFVPCATAGPMVGSVSKPSTATWSSNTVSAWAWTPCLCSDRTRCAPRRQPMHWTMVPTSPRSRSGWVTPAFRPRNSMIGVRRGRKDRRRSRSPMSSDDS